jgi:hypothetical protein
MKIITLLSVLLIIIQNSYGQYDIRKVNWGMTMEDVKQSELPLKPNEERYNKSYNQQEITYTNFTINQTKTDLTYAFQNGKLISITYTFYKTWQRDISSLFDKILYTKFVFENLKEKNFNQFGCWSYGTHSYSTYTKKYSCDYNDKSLVNDVERVGLQNKATYVLYSLRNERSHGRMTYFLLPHISPEIIGFIEISADYNLKKELEGKGF